MHPLDDADGEPGDRSGGMNTAKVISARRGEVPNSGRDALSIITDEPYLVCGEVGTSTGIYVDPACPEPEAGDPVSWHGGTVWLSVVRWKRFDYEFNPMAGLH